MPPPHTDLTLTARLEQCYTGIVFDVLRAMGIGQRTLPHDLRPLLPGRRLAGPAFTVEGGIREGLDPHETLLAWTGMLSRLPSGSVVVMQPNDSSVAHIGELSAEAMVLRGVRGFVVDGGARDTELIAKLGFPVFHRYFTPRDVVGCWQPTTLGEPIRIGDVEIATGDLIVGDRDGIIAIPAPAGEETVCRAEQAMSTESAVRKAILAGEDPQVAYIKYGKF